MPGLITHGAELICCNLHHFVYMELLKSREYSPKPCEQAGCKVREERGGVPFEVADLWWSTRYLQGTGRGGTGDIFMKQQEE